MNEKGMMQGPNGQMNGPQMNMGMNMQPNMMPGYQNWTSPQQQGYGYGNSNAPNSYQGWGAPPQAPPPQWSNYNPQQGQGYNNYDNLQYGNSTAGGGSASWAWLPNTPNNTAATGASGPDIYSRSQWAPNSQSTTGPISGIRTGPGNSASKSGSEYDYSGYGSGSAYDYDYNNYTKDQNNSTYAQRSAYGNDTTTQPQYPPSQAV